jgi:glycosyltransferase involved in cell wall biosynthesis
MKKKIALVTPTWEKIVGGVDIFNRDLRKIIENRGHSLEVFSLELFPETKSEISGKEKKLGEYFNKINEKNNYDIVICNGEYGYNVKHPRAINVFHGNSYDYARKLRHFDSKEKTKERLDQVPIQREAAKDKYVVSVSNFASKGLDKSGINVNKVINLSVDTNYFRPLSIDKKNFNLAVSRGDYYGKGLDIIENWAGLVNEETKFLGNYEGNLKNVVQPGFVNHQNLNRHYNESNVFFNPSRFEGGGLTTLEAMACECPVIVASTGYGYDIEDKVPEFVIKNLEDNNEFIEKYNRVKSDLGKYSKKSKEYFWEFHNPKVFEGEWINLIENF